MPFCKLNEGVSVLMDKTTINICPSMDALNAINCMSYVKANDKDQLRKAFRTFAMNTRYTMLTAFKGDIKYIPASPKNRMERFSLLTPDHTSVVATVWINVGMGLVQYSFKPSRLTTECKEHLDSLFQITLADGYISLYRYGTLSLLEYAVDVEDVSIEDVVLIDTGKRRYTVTPEGTTYCGCRRSMLVGVTYDKGAEIRLKTPAFTGTLLRHEVRKRATGCTIENWVESESVENLFAQFIPVPRSALRDLIGKPKAEQVRNFGLHAVFRNKPSRISFIKEVCKCRYQWANPDVLWSACRSSLIASLLPPELKVMKAEV